MFILVGFKNNKTFIFCVFFLMKRFISVVTFYVYFLCSYIRRLSKDHHTGDLVASDQVQPACRGALPQRLCWYVYTCSRAALLTCAWEIVLKRRLFTGAAIRHCDVERGWLEPDLYNCTSPPFVELNIAVRWILLCCRIN